jgi:FMN reductase
LTAVTHDPLTLAAVLGSVTPPGRLRRALAEALDRVDPGQARTELFDLGELSVAFADGRPAADLGDNTATVVDAIASADAVVLATPIYRGTLTGALKNLLDHVPVQALRDTPVAIVAMGATDHHYLGADRHLRDILSWFGALVVPTGVYLTSRDFDDRVPGERAVDELDAALASALALARATVGRTAPLGPAPFAARGR